MIITHTVTTPDRTEFQRGPVTVTVEPRRWAFFAGHRHLEVTTADGAEFWSVYTNTGPDTRASHLGDLPDRASAEYLAKGVVLAHAEWEKRATPVELTEAAMCLWEHVLELGGYQNAYPDLGDVGTCEARDMTCALAEPCHRAWVIAHKEGRFDDAFDWEFVPWFIENCVDGDGTLSSRWEITTRNTFIS